MITTNIQIIILYLIKKILNGYLGKIKYESKIKRREK